MSYNTILNIPANRRRLDPESEFFLAGNFERFQSFRKRQPSPESWVDVSDYSNDFSIKRTFKCVEVGCCQEFICIRKYEEHKFKCHSHQCSVCSRSFTTDRLLSFHISELHDNYFAAASKKKPMYTCLVESCQEVFWSDQERREHLIKQHHYHGSYDFHDPKKFLRKFQQKLAHATTTKVQGESHMKIDTGPSDRGPATELPDMKGKGAPAIVASTVQPGGNRAQRRAQKRNEYETTSGAGGGADLHASAPSVMHTSSLIIADQYTNVGEHHRGYSSSGPHVAAPPSNSITVPCVPTNESPGAQYEGDNSSVDAMQIDDGLDEITQGMRKTSIHVPSKISFGRRKGHH